MAIVDVAELIARYDHGEHVAKAEAYFANASGNPYYWRKPLYNGPEAAALLRNFSQVVTSLDLYPGVRLLDFGAGSCWSSRWFAYMGCTVTAVDVSRNALQLGEAIAAKDPIRDQLHLDFLAYDGFHIDLPDGSIDRIVCLDCFHHVPDQRATLAEFFRLLRPGGVIGFSEPGPRHSLTAQSQYEMRNYGVIENDIDLDKIAAFAAEIGFSPPQVSYGAKPRVTSVDEYNRIVSGDVDPALAKTVIDADAPWHVNERCFFLGKPGGPRIAKDSRTAAGLAHEMAVALAASQEAGKIAGHISIANVGDSLWLASNIGAVNVGVHLYGPDGTLINLDYARVSLGGEVAPGARVDMPFSLDDPGAGHFLEFDAVAEGVSWFDALGSKPVRIVVPG